MSLKAVIFEVSHWLGVERNQTSHSEKLISALGAAMAITLTAWLSLQSGLSSDGQLLIISSMGASAVLLFAVPHGALSQPWPVLGGHLISAFIGISCVQFLAADLWTAGIAVGLSVAAMYYLKCIHPPGGASALTAVVGGHAVLEMGYGFLLSPILLNVIAILLIAVSFNFLFAWRRYPAHFNTRYSKEPDITVPLSDFVLTTEDFHAAIEELDSFVDITEEGLTELLEKAKRHAQSNIEHPGRIERGHFYSNGNIGRMWSIRQVIDDAGSQASTKDMVIYKTVAGQGAYSTGYCDRESFRSWARFEVIEQDGLWFKRSGEKTGKS
jgi:CBS-domain-containing membrane protein